MADGILATGPLTFEVTVDAPSATDVTALRRGPVKVQVGSHGQMIRWDFNWLQFGAFEIFLAPVAGAPAIDDPATYDPGASLGLVFTFQDEHGRQLGGRMFAMPRAVATAFAAAWNRGAVMPQQTFTIARSRKEQ